MSDPHLPGHRDIEDHDRGLAHDLRHPRHRRAFLGLMGAGAATIGGAVLLSSAGSAAAAAAASVAEIPTETAGPYPGDGSNGPNALTESGIVRSDIRRSFGSSTTRARGQKFRFRLRLVDTEELGPLVGYAVYAWHCNRDGEYSMYGAGITGENYLRGVQVSNARGVVRFRSIYPACYSGRWPHIHFEVYRSLAEATGGGTPLVTSQMAMPRVPSMRVYAKVAGYEQSVTNLNRVSLSSDNVFGDDGGVRELAKVKGSLKKGLKASLLVPVDV
jgi:protocatechuate 3,4-dioxygenase beta subunit